MRTATETARKFFFRLFPDRLDLRGDRMNISDRTYYDMGLCRSRMGRTGAPVYFN